MKRGEVVGTRLVHALAEVVEYLAAPRPVG